MTTQKSKYDQVLITERKQPFVLKHGIELKLGIRSVTVGPIGSDAMYLTDGIEDEVQIQAAIDYLCEVWETGEVKEVQG
jgi:hypothetical protein